MSFSLIAKHFHPSNVARRNVSTTALPHASHKSLPSAKMRALISLYHQADNFITPENLSERIDQAFVPEIPQMKGSTAVQVQDLENALIAQRSSPKFTQWNHDRAINPRVASMDGMDWSTRRTAREQKVIEALYGVDLTQPYGVLPSLEALEESKEVIERSIKDDLEAAEQ